METGNIRPSSLVFFDAVLPILSLLNFHRKFCRFIQKVCGILIAITMIGLRRNDILPIFESFN